MYNTLPVREIGGSCGSTMKTAVLWWIGANVLEGYHGTIFLLF